MKQDFSEILREHLFEERRKNPLANETTISKKMNIPPTTFNRLLNGYSKPSVNTILKLSRFIPELKKSLPKEVMNMFEVTLAGQSLQYIGHVLESLLSDKNLFLCWVLAFSKKGITEEEIKESFGQPGISALKTLEKENIISKDESGCYRVIEKNKSAIFSFRLIKAHLIFLAEQYNPDNSRNNYIHYWVESLSREGREKVMRAHQEFHRVIRKIMEDERNKGDLPVFSIACGDMLSGKSQEGGK